MMKREFSFIFTILFAFLFVISIQTVMSQESSEAVSEKGFRGFVCDSQGKPFPDATVLVNMQKVKVNENGTFFVPHKELERQMNNLIVLAQGKRDDKELRCAHFVDYITGNENVTLSLSDNASISGWVLTTDRKPIVGAKVQALMNVGELTCHGTWNVENPVETNEAGQFQINNLYPDSNYKLWITHPGKELKMTDWIPVGRRELCDKIEIFLRDAQGFVAGKVVDEKGKPVADVRVVLGHPCIPYATCLTDKEGKFRINDLVPGEEVTLSVNWNFQKFTVGTENAVITFSEKKKE